MRILVMYKDIYEIAEKLAVRDRGVKKLLDTNKAVQAVIEKITKIIHSPISDAEKVTKVESIFDTLETD